MISSLLLNVTKRRRSESKVRGGLLREHHPGTCVILDSSRLGFTLIIITFRILSAQTKGDWRNAILLVDYLHASDEGIFDVLVVIVGYVNILSVAEAYVREVVKHHSHLLEGYELRVLQIKQLEYVSINFVVATSTQVA